jgi:hypothetical protein
MSFPELTIEPSTTSRGKGRTFRARLLGYLTADGLWELGTGGSGVRPIWLAYFASVGASKPFTANLRAGRKARIEDRSSLQIPKSSPHRWTSQTVPGGVATVAYLPELLHLEPPVPFTETARFVLAPPALWVDEQAEALEAEFGEEARAAARAALFAAYLDRRTPLPLLRDLRFHLELYQAALGEPWVYELGDRSPAQAVGAGVCGLDAPLACAVDLETLGEFLTARTASFHRLHLAPRRPEPVVDVAGAGQPFQLALDLAFA